MAQIAALRPDVRLSLVEAAGRLVERAGYRKTSVEDIAREAGLSRATAYLYFANKEALVLAWIEEVAERRLASIRGCLEQPGSPEERLRSALVERVLARYDQVQRLWGSLDELLEALRPALSLARARHHEAEAQLVACVVREFPVSDPLATSRLLLLATNALLPDSLSGRQLPERPALVTQAEALLHLLVHGLR